MYGSLCFFASVPKGGFLKVVLEIKEMYVFTDILC